MKPMAYLINTARGPIVARLDPRADYHAFLASRASTVSGVSTVAAHIYRPLALSTSAHLGYSYNWR